MSGPGGALDAYHSDVALAINWYNGKVQSHFAYYFNVMGVHGSEASRCKHRAVYGAFTGSASALFGCGLQESVGKIITCVVGAALDKTTSYFGAVQACNDAFLKDYGLTQAALMKDLSDTHVDATDRLEAAASRLKDKVKSESKRFVDCFNPTYNKGCEDVGGAYDEFVDCESSSGSS